MPNLDVVFCGTAVSDGSAKKGKYYAGKGNKFYKILHEAGLTSKRVQSDNYEDLLDHNVGLTDLVKGKSGLDDVLNEDDFDVDSFRDKILLHQPKLVCFNGKKAAAVFLGIETSEVKYGLQKQKIGNTKLYVASSTSWNARSHWKKKHWDDLKKHLKI